MAEGMKHLRSLLDGASDLFQVILPDGQVCHVNPACCRALGFSSAEMASRSFFDLLHPNDRDRVQQLLLTLQAGNPLNDLAATLLTRDGNVLPVKGRICIENPRSRNIWCLWQIASPPELETTADSSSSQPPTELGSNLAWLQAEVCKHQQANAILQDSEERCRSIIAALQEAIVIQDHTGQICACNASAERILGLSGDRRSQRSSFEWKLIREDGLPFPVEEQPARLALQTGKPASRVVMGIYKPNGTLTWVSANSRPLFRSGQSRPHLVVTSLTDITAQKQTELALRRSEARYRAIVENQTELVCRFLPDGTLTFVNEAYCRVMGIPREELTGYNYKMFLLAVEPETTHQLAATYTPEQPICSLEHRVILSNGKVCWQQWNNQAIFDQQGNIIEFQAVGRDITQRKEMEEALRASEAKLTAVLGSTIAAITCIRIFPDRRWEYEYLSPGYETIYSYPAAQFRADQLLWRSRIVKPDLEAIILPVYEDLLTGHIANAFIEYRFLHQDNSLHWIAETITAQRDPAIDGWMITTVATDITARKLAEEALRRSEAELRALFAAMTDAVLVVSRAGQFLKVVSSQPPLFGHLTETELVGKTVHDLMPPDLAESCMQLIEQALHTQQKLGTEYSLSYPDRQQWISVNISPLAQNSVLWVAREITERKRAEVEILKSLAKEKELNELKSRFVSMISHEFRTPLTTIQSATELLEYYEWSDEERQERFQQIHTAVQHMTQLLEDVLLIGKVEAGKLKYQPELLNLTEFCQKLLSDLQLTTRDRRQIRFASRGTPQMIWIDTKLLRQILTNLLSNARKYSLASGNIGLELDYQTDRVKLQVWDEGIGIPSSDRDRLFEAFYRATNVDVIPGTGLGLAIVKKCVDLHGGQVSFETELGSGTTFTVVLPVSYLPDPEIEPIVQLD